VGEENLSRLKNEAVFLDKGSIGRDFTLLQREAIVTVREWCYADQPIIPMPI